MNSKSEDVIKLVKQENYISFSQDAVHLATKQRNRLLKASSIFPMGDKQASVSHLKIMISSFPKDIHGLVMSDICPEDRQNYSSFEKVIDPHVLNCLHQHVIGSEATVAYLEMSRVICSAFIEIDWTPKQRIEHIWHALYFFRAWREWVKQSTAYNFENFISSNAFSCMEINAYALIHLIIKFRDEHRPDLFFPTLFTS